MKFQHTAARRRLVGGGRSWKQVKRGFNTQPPEGGWGNGEEATGTGAVSTHSRPKAAGFGFDDEEIRVLLFQHTAARRRLEKPKPKKNPK